jgi:aconitate decarboxylase
MQHAIGIAATQVNGLREMFGSHTKSFHPGRAAQSGLIAAILASNGYTSSLQGLEAKRGWANVVSVESNLDAHIQSLGRVWEITKNAYKPFPCGIVVHPIIDGCIQLHEQLQAKGENISSIRSVHLRVHPLVLELTGKKTPRDGLQAKFSVFHGGAVGLLLGRAEPAQYEDEVVLNDEIVAVRSKIDATADDNLAADETYITLTMQDGTTIEHHISHAVGSVELPMTDAQLEEKFVGQCLPILGLDGVEMASKACWALQSSSDVGDIARSL